MGDLGLFGLGGPGEYGGGGDFTSLCIAIEEIGRVDQSLGHHSRSRGRARDQPDRSLRHTEQKPRWLPDLLAGRALAGVRPDRT